MIRINLLPDEYKKKTRTPLKLMLTVAGLVAVNALALAWLAFLHLGVQAEIESEHSVLQTESDGLAAQVKYHKSLEQEKKIYSLREQALSDVTANRISWTRKADELIDIVNKGAQGDRHMVWFDDLIVQQTADSRSKAYGSMRASGHSGSERFDQIANFLDDVEQSSFLGDFQPPAPPEGTQQQTDKDLQPAVVWSFPLQLNLKSPEERAGKPKPEDGKSKPAPKAGAPTSAERQQAEEKQQ
jgi:Tfp pilus assembly protein PilN